MSRIYTDINGVEIICIYTDHIDDGVIIEQLLWSSPSGTPPKDVLDLFIEDDALMERLEQEIMGHIKMEQDELLIAEWLHNEEVKDYHEEI